VRDRAERVEGVRTHNQPPVSRSDAAATRVADARAAFLQSERERWGTNLRVAFQDMAPNGEAARMDSASKKVALARMVKLFSMVGRVGLSNPAETVAEVTRLIEGPPASASSHERMQWFANLGKGGVTVKWIAHVGLAVGLQMWLQEQHGSEVVDARTHLPHARTAAVCRWEGDDMKLIIQELNSVGAEGSSPGRETSLLRTGSVARLCPMLLHLNLQRTGGINKKARGQFYIELHTFLLFAYEGSVERGVAGAYDRASLRRAFLEAHVKHLAQQERVAGCKICALIDLDDQMPVADEH
jgi:hypothetical protein